MSNSMVRLSNVLDYAVKADQLGFNRLWLAEHHLYNRKSAWGCPLPIIPVIAGITQKLRVGTGGILLKLHNPFDVAAQVKLWHNIYGGRIDLGLANGGAPKIELLQHEGTSSVTFDTKFATIVSYLKEEEKLREKKIVLPPYHGSVPEVWALSTTGRGFHRALQYGTNYVRSIFHEVAELAPEKELFEDFKKEFEQRHGRKVKTMLSISGSCLRSESRLRELRREAAKDEKNHLIGSVAYFEEKFPELLYTYGADEIIWRDMNRNVHEKHETLELLSGFVTKEEPVREVSLH